MALFESPPENRLSKALNLFIDFGPTTHPGPTGRALQK